MMSTLRGITPVSPLRVRLRHLNLKCSVAPLLTASALLYPISAMSASETLSSHNAKLGISTSVSSEKLQWSIASDTSGKKTPNILSELTYQDLTFKHLTVWGSWQPINGYLANWQVGVSYSWLKANEGTTQDSDYDGDYRTDEYSRSYSDSSDSYGNHLEIWLKRSKNLTLSDEFRVTLNPKIGYRYRRRHLTMQDGVQVINTRYPSAVGPFKGELDSYYQARWYGMDVGLETQLHYGRHEFSADFELHMYRYYAEANWNLRKDFKHPLSFAHWAHGYGKRATLSYSFNFSEQLKLTASVYKAYTNSNSGDDIVYFQSGEEAKTQLHGVDWQAQGYTVGITKRW